MYESSAQEQQGRASVVTERELHNIYHTPRVPARTSERKATRERERKRKNTKQN